MLQEIIVSSVLLSYFIIITYFQINYNSEFFRSTHIIWLNVSVWALLYMFNVSKSFSEFMSFIQIYVEYIMCDYLLRYALFIIQKIK